MGLSNTLALVQTDLVAHLLAPLNAVTFKTGGRELTANDAAPRILWVRRPGRYGPGQQGVRNPLTTGRIVRTHEAHVDAHVWALPNEANGNDDSDTELLAHTLVASVYRATHGAFEVLNDDWIQPEWMTSGYLTVISFRFWVPVTDVAPVAAAPPFTMPFDSSTEPPPSGELQAPGNS